MSRRPLLARGLGMNHAAPVARGIRVCVGVPFEPELAETPRFGSVFAWPDGIRSGRNIARGWGRH